MISRNRNTDDDDDEDDDYDDCLKHAKQYPQLNLVPSSPKVLIVNLSDASFLLSEVEVEGRGSMAPGSMQQASQQVRCHPYLTKAPPSIKSLKP